MQIFHLPWFVQQQDHQSLRLRRLHVVYRRAALLFFACRHMQHFDCQIALLAVSRQNKRVSRPQELWLLLRAYRKDNIYRLQYQPVIGFPYCTEHVFIDTQIADIFRLPDNTICRIQRCPIFPSQQFRRLTYAKPLTEKQMKDYELKPAPGNPDRARPSITARLKDGARGQDPPKEPSQKQNHKSHEER